MRPQINLSCPTASRMWLASLAAFMAIMQSSLTDAFLSLVIAVTTALAAFFCEFIIYFRTEKSAMIKDGSAFTSALVLTLMLPNHISPIYAAVGVVFAMIVIKYSFGGLGSNWLNPAIGGWLFIRFTWPLAYEQALTNAAPMESGAFDGVFRDFLNKTVFSAFGAELPDGYITLFNATSASVIADRGALALLVGTIILLSSHASRVWTSVVYLGGYGLLIRLFGALPAGGGFGAGDILTGFLSGGTLVAAFFLAPEPVTGPKSMRGALIVAFIMAVFSFIFRYLGGELYGAFFAAALLNALVPIVRGIESRFLYARRRIAL
ncbi:MAG: RnfABCDGE type electron transport complex subunit D [Treponema sp.]|nr:RnfABCDGE type electron transport complex subunit D [Treponema sp.]